VYNVRTVHIHSSNWSDNRWKRSNRTSRFGRLHWRNRCNCSPWNRNGKIVRNAFHRSLLTLRNSQTNVASRERKLRVRITLILFLFDANELIISEESNLFHKFVSQACRLDKRSEPFSDQTVLELVLV
jgi:hypothetical protein